MSPGCGVVTEIVRLLPVNGPDREQRACQHHRCQGDCISCGVLNALPCCRVAPVKPVSHVSSACQPRRQDLRPNSYRGAPSLFQSRLLEASFCSRNRLQATAIDCKQADQSGGLPPPPPGSPSNPLLLHCGVSTGRCHEHLPHNVALQLAYPGRGNGD